ncbi:hypothetical protein E3E14_07105 [Streptomyces sp. ICN441]|nr:hypothetical protein E3E14_07105 [Streptomyces sp. ICN441]
MKFKTLKVTVPDMREGQGFPPPALPARTSAPTLSGLGKPLNPETRDLHEQVSQPHQRLLHPAPRIGPPTAAGRQEGTCLHRHLPRLRGVRHGRDPPKRPLHHRPLHLPAGGGRMTEEERKELSRKNSEVNRRSSKGSGR